MIQSRCARGAFAATTQLTARVGPRPALSVLRATVTSHESRPAPYLPGLGCRAADQVPKRPPPRSRPGVGRPSAMHLPRRASGLDLPRVRVNGIPVSCHERFATMREPASDGSTAQRQRASAPRRHPASGRQSGRIGGTVLGVPAGSLGVLDDAQPLSTGTAAQSAFAVHGYLLIR